MLRSIRVRLTAWYTAVLAVVLVAMAFGMYRLVDRVLERRIDFALFEASNTILNAAGDRPDRLAETIRRFRAPDRRLLLMTRDGEVIAQSDPMQFREFVDRRVFAIEPTHSAILAAVRAVPEMRRLPPSSEPDGGVRERRARIREDRRLRQRATEIADPDGPIRVITRPLPPRYPRDVVLVMLGSAREHAFILDALRNALAITALVALVLAALPGYFLARRALAPVRAMSNRAERIGAQNLDERLPIANPHDELGHLSRVLNDLLDRLQRAFEQQRRFMAEAAHELRTPVAVVRAESELALSKWKRSGNEYREALGVVESESRRMGRIVDDLLTLSRVEAGQYPLRRMPIEPGEIIARTARSLRVKADERDVSIDLQIQDLPPMSGDSDLLQRMFTNLLENAIRHARAGTEVVVEAHRGAGPTAADTGTPTLNAVIVRVINYGVAIDADTAARIFEPFFRGEQARAGIESRTGVGTPATIEAGVGATAAIEAGAGLGLPIAQWIARAHGGDVRLVQADGNPTVFEAVFPPE